MWKDVIGRLASATKILAEWRLSSGITFFMYLPTPSEMGAETIKPDSDIRFDEIAHLVIMQTGRLGALVVKNDINACREALIGVSSVRLTEIDGSLRISSEYAS